MIKTVGLVAGDAQCYDVFFELFRPVIAARHAGFLESDVEVKHPTVLDAAKLDSEPIDPTGRFVVSARIRAARNLSSIRFPPAITTDGRLKVEELFTDALTKLGSDFEG